MEMSDSQNNLDQSFVHCKCQIRLLDQKGPHGQLSSTIKTYLLFKWGIMKKSNEITHCEVPYLLGHVSVATACKHAFDHCVM